MPIDSIPLRRFITVTPVGSLFLLARGRYLVGVHFVSGRMVPREMGVWAHPTDPVLEPAALQIREYMEGRRREFDLPLKTEGSAFCERVWAQLMRIPYGQTVTYGQIAASLGNRHKARAVGQAVGANPLAIVVPCHRVVATGGRLGGFVGGSAAKESLLALESAHAVAVAGELDGQDQLF
ncbi:MAG: methylated-DNA--[protein]-cysteine S-methyltransferase [Actinomycetaceae bacterium]|nr:methylated-DNA--[protein]-cysteine S-methyltransferase [Actinomycetaceae bacterium]